MAGEAHCVFVIQMQRDLAVGLGDEAIAFGAQIVADCFEAIEFAVYDQVQVAARMSNRLIAVAQADNAQPHMAKRGQTIGGEPVGDAIGAAMRDGGKRLRQSFGGEPWSRQLRCNQPAHRLSPPESRDVLAQPVSTAIG